MKKVIIFSISIFCFLILFGGCPGPFELRKINITSPENGSIVSDTVIIEVTTSMGRTISRVEIYVDNELLKSDSTSPYTAEWNTLEYDNGNHKLKAVAYGILGIYNTDDDTEVTVQNAIEPIPTPGGSNWGEMVWGIDNWG